LLAEGPANCVIIHPATPNRKRGKSMSFRSGQSGTVVRKGQMWHGRYYVDVPGQETRRKASIPIGSIHTMKKNEAKRKLRAMLEEIGLNSDQHLDQSARGGRTFADEATWWRENRLVMFKPSTQEAMGSHLDKYLVPRFGSLPLAVIDERRVQEFIADMSRAKHTWPNGVSRKLSPKTIGNVVGVLKQILGQKVWRDWNLTMPEVPVKEQRYFTEQEMRQIVGAAEGQWRPLFATLAASGLRCGELFALRVEDLDLAQGNITVQRNMWNGHEGTLKTKQGYRVVSVEPALVEMLREHVGKRDSGLVFRTQRGTPFGKSNVRRKLNQILRTLKLKPAGLHAFRHGRVSVLQARRVPGDLLKEWVGHSSLRTTSRYTHFQDDFRQQIAAESGLFASGKTIVSPNSPNSVENSGASVVA
jgi:integrase